MSGTRAARERAKAFALEHGSVLACARARALAGDAASDAALRLVPEPEDAPATLFALEVCEELRALRAPLAQRAGGVAATLQADDGGFGDPSSPLDERLRLAGGLGGALARTPFARPETLDGAGTFLATHFSPERVQEFQWGNIAAYAHFFANALHDASDEILQWCGRELERGFRARRFDALATARVLVSCDAHALPGARLEREELLLALITEQGGDGSFGADPAPSARVEAALHGLRALTFLDSAPSVR